MSLFSGGFCEDNFFVIILVLFILLVIVGAGEN
ncbi:MAG TPA: sporulation protein YjcZ [Bacillota bacterium]|nr:sporulation protein YjcZ [Bacillota bacterium]